jgi:hypothetical protein
MQGESKRRAERVIPFVSDEEIVVIRRTGADPVLAKMMELGEVGTLVYLLADDLPDAVGSTSGLAVSHQGKVFDIPATIVRKNGRLITFEFANPSPEALRDVQGKLIRMEIDWMRLSRRG